MRSTLAILFTILGAAVGLAQTGSYEAVKVTDGGGVVGKVTLAGTPAAREKLVVNTDHAVCANEEKFSEALLIGSNGGVRNAAVYLRDVRRGKSWPSVEFTLGQAGCQFDPHVLLLPEHADLHLENTDRIPHSVHSHGADSVWQPKYVVKLVVPEFARKVSERDVIQVTCDIHKWMLAYVVVEKHPYYALTDENGSFELTEVPPGQYDLAVWHETLGEKTERVTIKPKEQTSVTFQFEAR